MQPVPDIFIASAETLCELINSPWVSFSTVFFKTSIHLTGQNHLTLTCWEPLDSRAVPPWPARGSATPPGRYLRFAVRREPSPCLPAWHCCSSLAHTERLASVVSCLSFWVWANREFLLWDRDHDKAGSHRAVCGRNQVITIKKSNYWVIKCARCQKLHEAEYK